MTEEEAGQLAGPYTFPREMFPIQIRAYGEVSGSLYWEETVEAPEAWMAVEVPPLRKRDRKSVV